WMAMPAGTSAVSPGASVNGASSMARRSMPAELEVAYSGRGNSAPMRGSSTLSCTSSMEISRVSGCRADARGDDFKHTTSHLWLAGFGDFLSAIAPIHRQRIALGVEAAAFQADTVGGDEVEVLALQFVAGVAFHLGGFSREPDHEGPLR